MGGAYRLQLLQQSVRARRSHLRSLTEVTVFHKPLDIQIQSRPEIFTVNFFVWELDSHVCSE
ncbi:hypothetical protein ANAPC5_01304 [Anaplasma phagocytophilum]|nr:hypothetical protein ANAPC5_01304 [Anaplasma phagocytophilum]